MLRFSFFLVGLFCAVSVCAQPANDFCTGATSMDPVLGDGTPVCQTAQDMTTASDGTLGSFPCESGGGNPDMWYVYTATGTQFDYTITHGTLGYSEIHLMESSGGTCGTLSTFGCATSAVSPHSGTFTGLLVGTTYYILISSTNANVGTFDLCISNVSPPATPGQDCSVAQAVCNNSSITVGTIASGAGAVSGNGSEEDVSTLSCFGGDERQSQWYSFTAADNGTFEFAVQPSSYTASNCNGDDYDWALWDITSSGCALNSSANNALACNWSFCKGATGLSPTWMGLTPGTDFCNINPTGPGDCLSTAPYAQWDPTVLNLTAGNTYTILVDNFSTSNSGFTLSFGGTATLGAKADFTFSEPCGTNMSVSVAATYPNAVAGWTFTWDWGDGNTDVGTTGTHVYGATGNYTISLSVVDPLGCSHTTSQGTVCSVILPIDLLAFDAQPQGSSVAVNWSTASASNHAFFAVERSLDNLNWETVQVQSAVETESAVHAYSHLDKTPFEGLSYYRIKCTDDDGTNEYSSSKAVMMKAQMQEALLLFPNPGTDVITVEIDPEEMADFKIYNAMGQLVNGSTRIQAQETTYTQLDISTLPEGVYLLVAGRRSVRFCKRHD